MIHYVWNYQSEVYILKKINYSYDYNGYDDVSQFFNSSYMNAKNSRIKDAKSKDANIKEG